VLWIVDDGLIHIYIHFFFVNTYIIYIETTRPHKQTCSCTQMFALCGNRTRDLLRSRRVFPSLRLISRQKMSLCVKSWGPNKFGTHGYKIQLRLRFHRRCARMRSEECVCKEPIESLHLPRLGEHSCGGNGSAELYFCAYKTSEGCVRGMCTRNVCEDVCEGCVLRRMCCEVCAYCTTQPYDMRTTTSANDRQRQAGALVTPLPLHSTPGDTFHSFATHPRSTH
jgi:hypothetical protein